MWWPFVLVSGLLFALGAAVGSFVNVVIYRTITDDPESWVKGRSHCEHCRNKIAWFDNLPVLSYLVLRGKCRHCQERINLSHPVVEFLTGALFVWWYWAGSLFFQLTQRPFQTLQPIFWLAVGLILIAILVADFLYLIIPDVLVGVLMSLTVIYRVALTLAGVMQVRDLGLAVMGMVLGLALFGGIWLLTRGRGMGLGDVKLIAPLALLVGWPKVMVLIFSAFIIGAVVGVGLVLTGKRQARQVVPFGPFLIVATILTLIWGGELLHWYLQLLVT